MRFGLAKSDRLGAAAASAAQEIFLRATVQHVIDIDHCRIGIGEAGTQVAIEAVEIAFYRLAVEVLETLDLAC